MKALHPAWIEIDTAQFRSNLQIIRANIGKSRFCLPVKANAYGHGLVGMARIAEDLVDCFGVSCLQEGVKLRQAGIQIPILVFGAIHEEQIEDLAAHDLEFSISSKFKAELVAKKMRQRCRVHLEVETGMQRTGMRPKGALELMESLPNMFDVVGVYSHLATSDLPGDPIALEQIEQFQELIAHPKFHGICPHIGNSGVVAHYKQAYFGMVRPGSMAYGQLPKHAPKEFQEIKPCFTLKAKVSYYKVVGANVGISYGHTYKTKEETRIVTVPIGYGDGYRRALSNKGSVLIRGKRLPIAGMVCMDQFMVDAGKNEVYVGDEVVLIGRQGDECITIAEIAAHCDTSSYEVACLINDRIPRIYAPL